MSETETSDKENINTLSKDTSKQITDDFETFPLRELQGTNKAFQITKGAIVDNLEKLDALDENIEAVNKQITNGMVSSGEGKAMDLFKELTNLKDERETHMEALSADREALRTRVSRIKYTIERVLHKDTILKTLFKEQGITKVPVIKAIGL